MRITLVKRLESILLIVDEIKLRRKIKVERKLESNVNKSEAFKEDSIICKLNEIKRMNRKGRKLLLECVNLKYNYDLSWTHISSFKGPFVTNGNIDYQKFNDDYFEAITTLEDVITKGIYLYDYKDIVDNKDFNLALEECLANYFALSEEYNHLLCNVEDHAEWGCPVEGHDKHFEIKDMMNNIIEIINLSTWKKLPGCCGISIETDESNKNYELANRFSDIEVKWE